MPKTAETSILVTNSSKAHKIYAPFEGLNRVRAYFNQFIGFRKLENIRKHIKTAWIGAKQLFYRTA